MHSYTRKLPVIFSYTGSPQIHAHCCIVLMSQTQTTVYKVNDRTTQTMK